MLESALIPVFDNIPAPTILEEPEYGVILDCQDRQESRGYKLYNWTHSSNCTIQTWKGAMIIGATSGTVQIVHTIDFPFSGLYRFELRVRKHPSDTGSVAVNVDYNQIGDNYSLNHKWEHYERIVLPVQYISSGSRYIQVLVTGSGWVDALFIYPIYRYTAGMVENTHSTGGLDVHSIEFTQNATNDLDSLTLRVGMEHEYWNPENDSLMVFGLSDHVTILLGENKTSLTPMFGGYITGPEPSDDKTILELNGVSRFMDALRVPTYHDFAIGTTPASEDGAYTQPYISFPNVHTLMEYQVSTLEYPINWAGIPFDYGFVVNFADSQQFNDVSVTNLKKTLDFGLGHPAPSLKLTPGHIPGATECVLWEGDPWDAVKYPYFNMDYHVSGAGAIYPLELDLCFNMFKAGEDIGDALDYYVRFTGTTSLQRVLGGYKQNTLANWPSLTFDLKSLLDRIAPSTEYNISQVSLTGALTQNNIDKPVCSALWLDNIMSYGYASSAPQHTSNGVNYPFDEIQLCCEETDHIAYIVPGLERREDVFVLKPVTTAYTDETLQDGISGNVLNIENWSYDPLTNGFANQVHRTFKLADETSSYAYKEDWDSIVKNGPFQDHEFLDDVSTQASADALALKYLNDHKIEKPAFTIPISGSTLIQPAHYIYANIISGRIAGWHSIKTITQKLDIEGDNFKTDVDLNQPSLRFKYKIAKLRDSLRGNNNTGAITRYREASISGSATNSPGAFTRL